MKTQWSPSVYRSDCPPDHLYLSQLEVLSLLSYWTGYEIRKSAFFNWKRLLGEATSAPRKRQTFYSNYLLAKFVRYGELMIQYGSEEVAVREFWNELDRYNERVQQITGLSEQEQRQQLQKDYTHGILAGRTSSKKQPPSGIWHKEGPITIPVTARVV